MGKITIVKGNIVLSPETHIIHGCNAQGKFRSGVAGAVRERYPNCYKAYMDEYEQNGLQLGNIIVYVDPKTEVTIYNAITQEFYGYDGKRYVDYGAIKTSLIRADDHCTSGRLAMPMIGAGLGGGDWDIISGLIEDCVVNNEPIVYVLD